jgi:hypothetical protein
VQNGTTSLAKSLLSTRGSFYVTEGKKEHSYFFSSIHGDDHRIDLLVVSTYRTMRKHVRLLQMA